MYRNQVIQFVFTIRMVFIWHKTMRISIRVICLNLIRNTLLLYTSKNMRQTAEFSEIFDYKKVYMNSVNHFWTDWHKSSYHCHFDWSYHCEMHIWPLISQTSLLYMGWTLMWVTQCHFFLLCVVCVCVNLSVSVHIASVVFALVCLSHVSVCCLPSALKPTDQWDPRVSSPETIQDVFD